MYESLSVSQGSIVARMDRAAPRAETARPFRRLVSYLATSTALMAIAACAMSPAPSFGNSSAIAARVAGPTAGARAGALPLVFEPNHGQAPTGSAFLAHGNGYSVGLGATGMRFTVSEPAGLSATPQAAQPIRIMRVELAGANPAAWGQGEGRHSGTVGYLSARHAQSGLDNIPTYTAVRFAGVYAGVDLLYYSRGQQLEYDFRLAPGADARAIRLTFDAFDTLALTTHGDLIARAAGFVLHQHAPVIYQVIHGARRTVPGGYTLSGHVAGFWVGAYNRQFPLIIDPVLVYSTYYGSKADDLAEAVAVDGRGNVYLAGTTNSVGEKTRIVFISKLDPTGRHALYTKYVSNVFGSHSVACDSAATGIGVDRQGNAYVTGTYGSADNIAGASCNEAVLWARVDPAGHIVVKTYGTADGNKGAAIAVDGQGNSYITGSTQNRPDNFPITRGAFQTTAGIDKDYYGGVAGDAFVLKIDSTGRELYGTFLGGSGIDQGNGIAVDTQGQAYVVGTTGVDPSKRQLDFPLTRDAYQTQPRTLFAVGFLSKLSADGSTLLYSTLLDGNDGEVPHAVAVNGHGDAYVTGESTSTNFPTTRNAYKPWCGTDGACNVGQACYYYQVEATNVCHTGNEEDTFLSVIDTTRSGADSLLYSTYIGGSSRDMGTAVAVDQAGRAYIAGRTFSHDFPMVHSMTYGGGWDAFVAEIDPRRAGRASLVFSSYLGGSEADEANGIAIGPGGIVYVTGDTGSQSTFPTRNAMQTTNAGGYDAFLTAIGGLNMG